MTSRLRDISRDIISATWREVDYYNSSMLARLTERLEKKQPAMLPFVLKASGQLGPEVQQLGTYLSHMIFRMEEKVKGDGFKPVSEDGLFALLKENDKWVGERAESAGNLIQNSLKNGDTIHQPHLLEYILELLSGDIEGGNPLTIEKRRKLFSILKTVVDAYEFGLEDD